MCEGIQVRSLTTFPKRFLKLQEDFERLFLFYVFVFVFLPTVVEYYKITVNGNKVHFLQQILRIRHAGRQKTFFPDTAGCWSPESARVIVLVAGLFVR